MPANDFAPGPGSVDPGKTYLIKGKTLADLLKKTIFDKEDFEVQESSTGRTVKVRNKYGEENPGRNMNLTIRYWAEDTEFRLIEMGTPDILYFRRGNFVGLDDPADSPDSLIEKEVSCVSAVS